MPYLSTDLVEKKKKMHPWHRQPFDEQLNSYKKELLPVLHWQHVLNIGPAFLFIYDYHARCYIYVSEEVRRVLGCSAEEYANSTMPFLHQRIQDLEAYYKMADEALQFIKYKLSAEEKLTCSVNMDFQYQHANGRYINLLQQSIELVFDKKGNIVYSLEKISDISHRPPETSSMLSIYTSASQLSHIYIPSDEIKQKDTLFTPSERRILRFLNRGYNTREIADRLDKSSNTVATHRKNMLKKAAVSNTPKLIRFAKQHGIL